MPSNSGIPMKPMLPKVARLMYMFAVVPSSFNSLLITMPDRMRSV